MAELVIFEFMIFYFGMSIILMVLFFLFKTIIKKHWFLYIPIILASIIFFPFGLILFGYCLRIYDERRRESKFYLENDPMSDEYNSEPIDPSIKW